MQNQKHEYISVNYIICIDRRQICEIACEIIPDTVIQQGDTVINPNTSESIIEREGYDQIASSIDPGDSSSGIVLFSIVSPEKSSQVITSVFDSLGQEYDFTIDVN